MVRKTLATTMLVLGSLVRVALVSAADGPASSTGQEVMPQPAHDETIVNRLDELGRTIFGGFLPNDGRGSSGPSPRRPATKANTTRSDSAHTSGGQPDTTQPTPALRYPTDAGADPPALTRPEVDRKSYSDPTADDTSDLRPIAQATVSGPTPASASPNSTPTLRPLHERLSAFRESAFGPPPATSSGKSSPSPGKSSSSSPGKSSSSPAGAAVADSPRAAPQARPLGPYPTRATRPKPADTASKPAGSDAVRSVDDLPVGRPVVTQHVAPFTRGDDLPPSLSLPLQSESKSDAKKTAKSSASGKPQDGVLLARKSPLLSVETVGPRRITVGKESAYELTVYNAGDAIAEDVVVFVNLPPWADVLAAEASSGSTQAGNSGDPARPFQWRLGQLAAGGKEKLTLRIVPRESRPFDLAVRWDCRPAASQTMIEVQEPKLSMRLEAPHEVYYGKKELFTLRISNNGSGDAENVIITLMPLGTGENRPASHRLGLISPGEEKALEVELTARQAGELLIQVEARGDGCAHAELAQKVLVRRANLRIDVEGPQMQYVGAVAAYRIRVTNSGNAPARGVKLTANLPPGGKYVSGLDNARLEPNGAKVLWLLDNLNPTMEQTYLLKCTLGAPGMNRLEIVSTADEELTASAAATTHVEAMADLTLEVKDPAVPIPVGDKAVYELRVRNRGTKAAEGVEVMAFFSRGVEPVSVEGGMHKIVPGQVIFNPIPSVGPGAEIVLKVLARADVAGNHVFRAEVHCKPLGTRLVSEQTTHFYQEGPLPPQQASQLPADSAASSQARRTADRREMLPAPPRIDAAAPAAPNMPMPMASGAGPAPAAPPREPAPVTR